MPDQVAHLVASRTVDWWSVHQYVEPFLRELGCRPPMAGTLPWTELADHDPAKLAAVLDGGRHWALRVDLAQAALADASRDVAEAEDWAALGRRMRSRNGIYIPREVA